MRKFLSLAVMCSLAFPAMAFAQAEPPKEAADEEMAAEEMAAEEPTTPAIEEMPEPPKVADDDLGEPEEGRPFLDNFSWMVMASANYRISGYTGEGVIAGEAAPYNVIGYPYTQFNGFGLNFAGGDVQYTGEKFAIRLDLRFGDGAPLLSPIAPIKQGYVSWLPSDKVSIDFGFFDTIFGGEVVDEWNNANYTRGALYFNRQPFNHMGIRSAFELTEKLGFTVMVTNGGVLGGTPIDNNETPTLGWQFGIAPSDSVGLFIGGQHGAGNDNDNKNWENFFDWVLSASAGIFTLIANGDYQTLPTAVTGGTGTAFSYGHSLQMIFDATDKFSIGLRGEHLSGNDQYQLYDAPFLATGTITLRYKPVEYLVLSLEGRGEWVSKGSPIYVSRTATPIFDTDGTTILGYNPNKSQNYAAILGFTAFIGN